MAQFTRIGAYAGAIAAASMMIAPAQAAEVMPAAQAGAGSAAGFSNVLASDFADGGIFDSSTYDQQAETAEWRGRRWRGRRGWRRGRVRGGDVLAGVLVLGGIAAIASAANNNRRRDREVVVVDRDNRRYDDRRYDDRRNPRASGGSGLDNAVSQCLTEIERDVRVDSVDGASRLAQGWVVSGTLFNGSGFTCQIGNDGRISSIDYNGFSGSSYNGSDNGYSADAGAGQLSDQSYADARAAVGGQASPQDRYQAPAASGQMPAYPGGPLPGETFPE